MCLCVCVFATMDKMQHSTDADYGGDGDDEDEMMRCIRIVWMG